jgi:hypothetical protein
VTARELVIVSPLAADVAADVPGALGAARVVAIAEHATPGALAGASDVARADVLWLPPWTVLTPDLVSRVHAWRVSAATQAAPRVARARLELRCGDTLIARASPALVLSSPASVDLDGDLPRPLTGAQIDVLPGAWPVALPSDLRAHLEAVNAQSSASARLRHASGAAATWRALLVDPVVDTLRGIVAVRGSRRDALPRLVIESYREVLVAAKLWEHAHDESHA